MITLHVKRSPYGGRCFVHGHRNGGFQELIAGPFPLGSPVRVVRDGRVVDEGNISYLSGHKQLLFFSGLEKIVPSEGRIFRTETGQSFIPKLLPEWFQVGDRIWMDCHPSTFGLLLRKYPEWWR